MDEKDIISTDFNYDIYSGGNAKKYLDEYNARKKQEAEENAKTDAERLPVYCRKCKREMLIDIHRGQSFESRSPDQSDQD